MGDFGSFLFGGSEQAGAPRIDQAPTLTPEQQATLKKLNELVGGQLGTGATPYSGQLTPGASGLQTQSWDAISKILGGQSGGASQDAISRIMQGSSNVPGAAPVKGYDVGEFNPSAIQSWYKDALVNPAMENWENSIVPQIQEKFIGQNAGSSGGANRAIAGSAKSLMSDLNAQLASALMGEKGAYDTRKFTAGMDTAGKEFQSETDYVNRLFSSGQDDLNRIMNVPGMESTSMNDLFKAIGLGSDAGATQRDITGQGLNEEYTKWQQGQAYNNPWLSMLAQALGIPAFENVVQPEVQKSGLMQDLIAPVAQGYASSGGFN